MAGVTDLPFRKLCREFGERSFTAAELDQAARGHDAPAGLYVMEMITSRALVEGNLETWRMIEPDPQERVRSVQLYGVNPSVMAEAARLIVERGYADHIDMNFGCPVPKVTKRGGGAALPWKRDLFQEIVSSVVTTVDALAPGGPGSIPVTVKMRIGIDDDHVTVMDAAKVAQNCGVAGVGLHARTCEQYYSGTARWEWIARLKESLSIPVFGNGDVFSGQDCQEMLEQTGCDGVIVGRGCQGRPWIFDEIVAGLNGRDPLPPPNLGQVAQVIMRHSELMVENCGNELRALREMRKHIGWYLRGFAVGGPTRQSLGLVSSLAELESKLNELDLTQPFPPAAWGHRGRSGKAKTPHLPHNWLESHEVSTEQRKLLHLAEDGGSGG